jgi:hypothetical protein
MDNLLCKIKIWKRMALVLLAYTVCSSCGIQKYNFVDGDWKFDSENYNIVNNEKGFFVCGLFGIEYPLSSQYEVILPQRRDSFPDYKIDKYYDSMLKRVGYNAKTDSIYFILHGYLCVFSSPVYDLNTFGSYIDLTTYEPPTIAEDNRYIKSSANLYIKDDSNYFLKHHPDSCIFRTIYCSKKDKQFLVKDVYKKGNQYLNFLYIYQSRTDKFEKSKLTQMVRKKHPIEIMAVFDMTDIQSIYVMARFITHAERITIANALRK